MVTPDRRYDPELVPPEWSQWLKMTRREPPTEEEVARYLPPSYCLATLSLLHLRQARQAAYVNKIMKSAGLPPG